MLRQQAVFVAFFVSAVVVGTCYAANSTYCTIGEPTPDTGINGSIPRLYWSIQMCWNIAPLVKPGYWARNITIEITDYELTSCNLKFVTGNNRLSTNEAKATYAYNEGIIVINDHRVYVGIDCNPDTEDPGRYFSLNWWTDDSDANLEREASWFLFFGLIVVNAIPAVVIVIVGCMIQPRGLKKADPDLMAKFGTRKLIVFWIIFPLALVPFLGYFVKWTF
ncbi:hypothetical protein Pelo_7608 [Pelomyxa schiedti]|nr:hypothetical protein Pelo_7608 [Pelomyxa schiedti]